MKICMKDKLIEIFGNFDAGHRLRKGHIISEIRKLNPYKKTILDAGSGVGDYIFLFAKKYPRSQFVGVEMDSEKVKQCKLIQNRKNIRNIEFIHVNLENFFRPNRFDIIYSVDTLEHIANDDKVLINFYKSLRLSGILLLHVPNINQKRYFGKFKNWEQEDHVRNGYKKNELVDGLTKTGFVDIQVKFTCGCAGALAWEIQNIFKIVFSHRLAQIISFPFTVVLSFIDTHLTKTSGNGILLVSKK